MRHMMLMVAALLAVPQVTTLAFERDVAPILVSRCLECHSGPQPKGKLDLTTRANALKGGKSGPALVAGNLQKSELWLRVAAGEMPPRKPLPAAEKKVLQAWIAQGGVWGKEPLDLFARTTDQRAGHDWWSLQPLSPHPLPLSPEGRGVEAPQWGRNAIDIFVLLKRNERALPPSPEADRRTLIRRVTFDLIGLPPTLEQVAKFIRDPRPDAYERLVDELLESPRLGERWARHWLDVVRFGESHGFEHDELRKNAWPYRDWVIDAFNKDLPYDEFVRRQIAGDVLFPDNANCLKATGFLVAGGYDSVGQRQQSVAMKAVVRQDELEDMVGTLSQTFLGLTVHCARCHDHKFDPIRQTEYYQLAASLAGVRHGERQLPATPSTHEQKAELAGIEGRARALILAERKKSSTPLDQPRPLARWDFTRSLDDAEGKLHVSLHGDAQRNSQGLVLSGKGYATTSALTQDIKARTLSVWVKLQSLDQRGGAAMTLQTTDGGTFDAIVFGEKEAGKWLAGSDFFRRSITFGGPAETQPQSAPVHVAIVYGNDGSISAFRNGQPYGSSIRPPGPVTYPAGKSQVLFGLRHTPAGGNKHLAGIVTRAELFDMALSPGEVAAVAGASSQYVAEEALLAQLAPAEKKRRTQLQHEIAAAAAGGGKVYAVAPQTPEATFLLLRGEPGRKAQELAAGGVRAAGPADFALALNAGDAERRRKLAEWITTDASALLARVMVNRLWHYHFGAGIVESPSDFGFNGGRPSHPELLDWLANEFRSQGWSIKKMHRLIVTSATYRQASHFHTEAAKTDAGNRLLWRKSPMRLEAEAMRDAVLSVAGKLNLKMGGPGYQDFKLAIRGATHNYLPYEADTDESYRRSIYRTWVRSGRNPLLDTLDCPDPSTATPRRSTTTTPLQSLSLLNSDFMLRMADYFAQRLERDAGQTVDGQVRRAYELALARTPSIHELTIARQVVEQNGLAVLCRALFNCNEFMYVD